MVNEKINIANGKMLSYENIIVKNNGIWEFENNDPQMIIQFNNPIKSLQLELMLNEYLSKNITVTIYYDYNNAGFSEEKKIMFNKYLFWYTS